MDDKYLPPHFINRFFEGLNEAGIEYVLIKNICGELPDHLIAGKDIDILVHSESMNSFHDYMRPIARKIIHPFGKEYGWRNLYGLEEFEKWRLNTSEDILVDVSCKLCCQCLMPKMWLPLDGFIQQELWRHRIFESEKNWWRIDNNVLYSYLVIRSVFDKRCFTEFYIDEIERLAEVIDAQIVKSYFKLVFFKYTDTLFEMLENRNYHEIISRHLRFKGY